MGTITVRYIVDDVDAAIEFYRDQLEFEEVMHPAPTFAILDRGDLRLLLSAPSEEGGGGRTTSDGRAPQPGGWNRVVLYVDDLTATAAALRERGVGARGEIVNGVAGDQIVVEDPSGNPIELFQPHI